MIQPDNLLERLAARAKKRREFAEHAETKPAFYGEVAPRLAREEAAILDEAAEQLRLSRRRVGELESALKEMDDLVDEYPHDLVGTGSMPPKKEQRRVDEILERSRARRAKALGDLK